jgi:hypothetical protein
VDLPNAPASIRLAGWGKAARHRSAIRIRYSQHAAHQPVAFARLDRAGSIVLARSCWLDRADDVELSAIDRQTVA